MQRALREAKKQVPQLYYVTDVCMCEYTSHGHCGVLCGQEVENDATLELLAKTALSHVQAGADMVAPSDMDEELRRSAGSWTKTDQRDSDYVLRGEIRFRVLRSFP